MTESTNNKTCLLFQTRDELIKVDLSCVAYFESDGNYTKVFFINECSVIVLTNLGNIEKLLDENLSGKANLFIRIGRQYIINSKMIFRIDILHQHLVLSDCIHPAMFTLSVGKEALKNLKTLYIEQKLWK